jgi:hypothetical protein
VDAADIYSSHGVSIRAPNHPRGRRGDVFREIQASGGQVV